MLGTRTLRDRSTSRERDAHNKPQKKPPVKIKAEEAGTMESSFEEPKVVHNPSFRDHHGGSHYGVAEHMQPLGEAPNARVKARVKADGGRKSMLGKGAAGLGVDAQETPDGTPAPPSAPQPTMEQSPAPKIVVEDENDYDYAPNGTSKRKERAAKPRAARRLSGLSGASRSTQSKGVKRGKYFHKADPDGKIREVVEEAKRRAVEVGKPELAAAVNQIYIWSLDNERLMELLKAILKQNATDKETEEFQNHVRKAKKQLKAEKEEKEVKLKAETTAKLAQSLPLRSPSKFTPAEAETSAIPSTERTDTLQPQAQTSRSAKDKSPSKSPHRRRSGANGNMSKSPSRDRSGGNDSDSSLTDLTSNPDDDMDVDEPESLASPGPSATATAFKGKDHAAERGSLTAPNRNLKRSSAEAELQDDERDRVLEAKKRKLNETVQREYHAEESNIRTQLNGSAARLRTRQGKNASLAVPSLSLKTNGKRTPNGRGSRAASSELDSPLSDAPTQSSRQSTPHVPKAAAKIFGKKAKTKQSPEKKNLSGYVGMPGASGAGRESPIGDDDNEELSENNDFCSACGGSGFLLCCDGCDRSFHFSCLDPPLNEDASELNEPWFCYICVAKRPLSSEQSEKPPRGLFAALLNGLRKRNPSNFSLPQEIRDYFEGVATDRNGAFVEAVNTRSRNRPGYDEIPDYTKVKDGKGNTILCYSCGKSSQGTRQIIPCDFCGEHWHLDCLDPPLANPPARGPEGRKVHDWMCPLHADHELRKVDTSLLDPRNLARRVHIRRPRNAKVIETSLNRGFRNNGVIDIVEDDSDDTDSEFFEEEASHDDSIIYRLPATGIKLDFIDKVKSTRVQQLRSENVYKKARIAADAPRQLAQANFARRSFREQQMALNLAQFANSNQDLDLGSDQVENLVGTLIAEAPAEVVDEIVAGETADAEKARSASSAIPPSPPSSEQPDVLSEAQRKELLVLQELIRRKLDGAKT